MPSIISAGTTTGTALNLTGDTSGELQIRTNNGSTTAMTLTTAGNVGIGITSPTSVLHLSSSSQPYLKILYAAQREYALTVTGSTTSDGLAIRDESGSLEIARFCRGGNVGIGATTITSLGTGYTTLQTQGTNGSGLYLFRGTSTSMGYLYGDSGGIFLGTTPTIPLRFYTADTERMRIDSSGNVLIATTSQYGTQKLSINGGIAIDGQNAATPGLSEKGDTDTGIFWPTANTLGVTTAGAERMRIDASGNVAIGNTSALVTAAGRGNLTINGSSSAILTFGVAGVSQGYIFNNGTDLTTLNDNAGALIWENNGGERMRITSAGELLVGGTTSTTLVNFQVQTGNTSAANAGFQILNSTTGTGGLYYGDSTSGTGRYSGYIEYGHNTNAMLFATAATERMRITSDGYLLCPGVFNNTTANAANVYVFGTGDLTRSTSSRKYKTDIVDYNKGLSEVMQLRPVSYKGINDGDKQFAGLIAEEVEEQGLVEFVQYADDGTPDGLAYPHMIAILTKAIQELKTELDSVKAELQTLKGA
jgi:hypothetical protein